MVVDQMDQEQVDLLFHALADATRRDIVTRTMTDDYSVSALARSYTMSFAAVQKHVAILERAELVTKRPRGREQLVRGNVDTLRTAYEFLEELEELWRGRINRLSEIINEPESEKTR